MIRKDTSYKYICILKVYVVIQFKRLCYVTINRDNKRRSFYNEPIPLALLLTRPSPPSHNIIIVTRILASFSANNNQLFFKKTRLAGDRVKPWFTFTLHLHHWIFTNFGKMTISWAWNGLFQKFKKLKSLVWSALAFGNIVLIAWVLDLGP